MTPQDLRDKVCVELAMPILRDMISRTKALEMCYAAYDARDAELAALKAEVAELKERGELWQGHAEANHALLMRAEEMRDAYKAQAARLAEVVNSVKWTTVVGSEKHEWCVEALVEALEVYDSFRKEHP